MRSENEQVHYRTRFRLCPFETKKPAIVAAYLEIMSWVLGKERKTQRCVNTRQAQTVLMLTSEEL